MFMKEEKGFRSAWQGKLWMRPVALLVVAVFLPQQLCFAGIIEDLKSGRPPSQLSIKSAAEYYSSTAQSYVSKAQNTYTAATNVYSAVKSVTGISPSDFISSPTSVIVSKLGINAINNYRNLPANNPQKYSQQSTPIQSPVRSQALNSSISSLPALSTQNTLSSGTSLNNGIVYNFDNVPKLTNAKLRPEQFTDRTIPLGDTTRSKPLPLWSPAVMIAGSVAHGLTGFVEGMDALAGLEWWAIGQGNFYQKIKSNSYLPNLYGHFKVNNIDKPQIKIYGEKDYYNSVKPTEETLGFIGTLFVGGGEIKTLGITGDSLKIAREADLVSDTTKINSITKLTENIGFKQGVDYLSKGRKLLFDNRIVRPLAKYTGYTILGAGVYSLFFSSPEFRMYNSNNGQIGDLTNDFSKIQNSFTLGSLNTQRSEALVGDLLNTFSANPATQNDVKVFLESKYPDIRFDDQRILSDLTKIASLNNENTALKSKVNIVEKVLFIPDYITVKYKDTSLSIPSIPAIGYGISETISGGINSLGFPNAASFVKMVTSFNPLTGPSIGSSIGSDPAQGWNGIASFLAGMPEKTIGLRQGSTIDRLSTGDFIGLAHNFLGPIPTYFGYSTGPDYHANFGDIGGGLGTAFIIWSGGRGTKGVAGDIKINTGSFLDNIKPKVSSSLANYPQINKVVTHPSFVPAVSTAAMVGIPAVYASYQGWQDGGIGGLGKPAAAGMVLFGPSFIKNKVMPSQQGDFSINLQGIKEEKDIGLDNALSLFEQELGRENILNKNIERTGRPSAYPEDNLVSHNNIFKITSQLLDAKVGEPIILIPVMTLPAFNYNNNGQDLSKYTKKLLDFQKIYQMERKEKITKETSPEILQQKFKKYGVNQDAYNEYGFHRNEFKAMGGDFENFIANLGIYERKGAWAAEVEGFQIVEAIHKLERGQSLPDNLKRYEAFASIHIENNRIRRSINEKPLEYDPLSIGLGWSEVKDLISSNNNNPSKTIYDLACAGGKTEEAAIVMRFLSDNFPKEEILYHTSEDKLVNEFLAKPIFIGAKVNKVEPGTISSRRYPYKEGINVFDNHTLLELTSTKYLGRDGYKSYIKGRHLFTDEPQAAMQSADLVKSHKGLLQPFWKLVYRQRNEHIYKSVNGLWEITRRKLGAELNRDISLNELKNNEITAELLKKGIIRNEGYGRLVFNSEVKKMIMEEYKKSTYLDKTGARRYYDYGEDMGNVMDILAGMVAKKMAKDYYIYKVGEYCIGEANTGAQRPRTHFGGQGEGALNNLQAQMMAVKHGWDFKSFEEVLMDKTKHAANYVQALEDAKSVSGFSGTAPAYELSFDRLKIPVRQIGRNYNDMVKEKTSVLAKIQPAGDHSPVNDPMAKPKLMAKPKQVTLDKFDIILPDKSISGPKYAGDVKVKYRTSSPKVNKDKTAGDIKEASNAEIIRDDVAADAKTSLRLGSASDAKELNAAYKQSIDWQKQTKLDSDFASKDYKTILPRDIKVNLITYNTVQNIRQISQLPEDLKDKFIEMLLADRGKGSLKIKTRSEALEFITRKPDIALAKLKEFGADLDIINYQQQYIKFITDRKNNPSQKRILWMQGLIEGSNVAAKIAGDESEAKMFLFGLQPEANVLQAGERVGMIPSVARRRMTGEYKWIVRLDDLLLTSKERDALSRAKTEQEAKDILFEASQRLQLEINLQNIYKVKHTDMSPLEAARNVNSFIRKTKWDYKKTGATTVSFDSVFTAMQAMKDEDIGLLKSTFNRWVIPGSNVLNHEGAALFDLAKRLMSLSKEEKIALRNLGFSNINNRLPADGRPSLRQALKIAEFLYQKDLVYFDIDTNEILKGQLGRLVSVGGLINSFGIKVEPEEISYLVNTVKSDFAVYNLIIRKLTTAKPVLSQKLKKQLEPVIEAENKLSRTNQKINSISSAIMRQPKQSFSRNPFSYTSYNLNILKYKISSKFYERRLKKITEIGVKAITLADIDKVSGLSAANFALLLAPNLNEITNEELGAVERVDKFLLSSEINNKVDRNSISLGEIMNLAAGKMSVAEFVATHFRESDIKQYARLIFGYEDALRKHMLSYIQTLNGKVDKNIQSLQEEILAKNLGINFNAQLNLKQLRGLSAAKVSDELLLRIYLGFGVSDEEIEGIILDEQIENTVSQEKIEVSEVLSELAHLIKLKGTGIAIEEVKLKYQNHPEVVNEAVKQLNIATEAIGKIPSLRKFNQFFNERPLITTPVDMSLVRTPAEISALLPEPSSLSAPVDAAILAVKEANKGK